jgi:hypothetical protein
MGNCGITTLRVCSNRLDLCSVTLRTYGTWVSIHCFSTNIKCLRHFYDSVMTGIGERIKIPHATSLASRRDEMLVEQNLS